MIRIAIAAAVFAVLAPAPLSAGQVTPLTPAVSHAQSALLYERACANCHGPEKAFPEDEAVITTA